MLASLWYSLQFAACSLKLVCSAPISEGELQFVEVIFSPLYQYFTDGFISMFKHHCVTWRNTVVKIHTPCPCKEVVARDTAELNSPPPSPSYSRVYLFKHILQITFLCSFHGRHPSFLCARTMPPSTSCGARVRQGAPPTFVYNTCAPFCHTLVKMSMFADKIVCNRKCLLSCCTVFQEI